MRPVPSLVALFALPMMVSCAADVGSTGLAINDPLDLIDDVQGPLRLFVLRADGHRCDATTGAVAPDVPDVEQGTFEDAVADIALDVASSRARGEVTLPAGEYVVLVRGKGTDPVTGIPNTFIATGCSNVGIEGGQTLEIRITLIPIVGSGVCGDGVPSPDEQCEDGNTTGGDGCSAGCRTEPFAVSTSAGTKENPSLGGAPGRRWTSTFDNERTAHLRLLEPNGAAVATPSVLITDSPLADAVTSGLAGIYALSSVAVASNGRVGASVTNFSSGFGHIRLAFFDGNRNPEGAAVTVRDRAGSTASPPESSVAFAGDGSFMVVFQDTNSATGLSGQVFAPGSTSPVAADPFPVGQGTTGGTDPVVAGASDHFVVAFTTGGDVFLQRFGAGGAARDANAIAVLEDASGAQDQPAVGALADGRALVAWREEAGTSGDGAGSGIRARAFTASGAPAGPAFVLNTTTAGDQAEPSVAGSGTSFAVAFQSGSSLRARVLAGSGDPILNRERPPTTADFEVAVTGAQPAIATGGPTDRALFMATWSEGGNVRGRLFPIP